ncbi:MAG: MBL fold metallo-hydrolase [Granulosicoccus sp.]
MNKQKLILSTAISLLMLSACSSDDEAAIVDFGAAPAASIISSGTVEVLTDDTTRYHVLTFEDIVTSTIVESETGAIIVDVSFELTEASTSSTELRAYADALDKPLSVIITHAHRDHFGNIASFADTNVYAETKNAAALLADATFTSLFSGTVNAITGSTQIADLEVVFDNVSNTEAPENGFIYIPSGKALFLGDLVFNRSHGFIRDYTPLDDVDELDIWIAALNDAKTRFADYSRVFMGHTGYRSDVSVNLDENIDYLEVSQGLIKGTRELSAGGIATSVQDVTDELALLYPDYKSGGLLLALPNGFFEGDPGANWFP